MASHAAALDSIKAEIDSGAIACTEVSKDRVPDLLEL